VWEYLQVFRHVGFFILSSPIDAMKSELFLRNDLMKMNERSDRERQLIEMRKRLLREVQSVQKALREDVFKPGEISSLPTHPADADVEGLDSQVAISQNEESLLEQVEEAIERLQTGTYGVCLQCGHKIGVERLNAVPYAAHCIDCARSEPDYHKRPVTGEPRRRW
jgi:DnaK suppressor protein